MRPDESDSELPWSSTATLLAQAFQSEVATNPLPATVKQRVLERTLGGREQVQALMRAMGHSHLTAIETETGGALSIRESVSMELLDHAHCDGESIEALRRAHGAAFPAWAHLLAFASYARWALIGMPLAMRETGA